MNTSLKIRQIESKISALQTKLQHLLKQRQHDIAEVLSTVGLIHIDDPTLIGGLMFLKNKITSQNSIAEEWRNIGDRFLRRTKKSKRLDMSKRTATPPSTHQSPQKHSQSREK